MLRAPALATDYPGFLLDTSLAAVRENPWRDVRLRKAVSLAIDRERIVTHLLHGIGRRRAASCRPGCRGMDGGKPLPTIPNVHAPLLAEAGHPGEGLPPLVLTTTASYLDICEFIQHELAGIRHHRAGGRGAAEHPQTGRGRRRLPLLPQELDRGLSGCGELPAALRHGELGTCRTQLHPLQRSDYDAIYDQALRQHGRWPEAGPLRTAGLTLQVRTPAVFLLHPEVVRFRAQRRGGPAGRSHEPVGPPPG